MSLVKTESTPLVFFTKRKTGEEKKPFTDQNKSMRGRRRLASRQGKFSGEMKLNGCKFPGDGHCKDEQHF